MGEELPQQFTLKVSLPQIAGLFSSKLSRFRFLDLDYGESTLRTISSGDDAVITKG